MQAVKGNLEEVERLCLALSNAGLLAVPGKRVQSAAVAPEMQVLLFLCLSMSLDDPSSA